MLRLGLLDGLGASHARPNPALGATLDTEDAGRALLAALTVPSGTYNVCRDGERVSNQRFIAASGWHAVRLSSPLPAVPAMPAVVPGGRL